MHLSPQVITRFLVLFPLLFVIITATGSGFAEGRPLYLNEIMASNAASLQDGDGDTEDWIEIFYDGEEPLNLEGYGLSDDNDDPFRWTFPDITLAPGSYLLVWTSGKDRTDPGGELHTNFSIAMAGEEVLLTAPDENRLDELTPTRIPTDISIGRYPDGTGDWFFYEQPSPGESNHSDGYQELLEPVSFSHEGGFYTDSFPLELTHPDPDVRIIYTLDGSVPDPDNLNGRSYDYMDRYGDPDRSLQERTFESYEYDNQLPLSISDRTDDPNYFSRLQSTYDRESTPYYFPSHSIFKGTVVRARAVREGALSGKPQTRSYFVTSGGRDRYSLPVISFAVQEDYLFDYEDGIYVAGKVYNDQNPGQQDGGATANYNQRGIEWERPASMELFEPESDLAGLRQDMGVRIHGGWSRSHPMKSLRLYARNDYGDNRFYHPVFPGEPYNEYNRLMLRGSGNDWPETMMRDALMQEIIGHMKFDTQAYRPFIVFINGEYWGLHNLRERYDKHYLARVHGVDPENIDLLEGNAWVKEGDNSHYTETMHYIRSNDLDEEEHYEHIRTRIDMENYIDYQISQIFVGNSDWPGNNIDFWRNRTGEYDPEAPPQHDGRWRWLAYDHDFGFNLSYGTAPGDNVLRHALGEIQLNNHGNPPWSTELFEEFMESGRFQREFINRYLDQLNTAFQSDRMAGIINDMASRIEPEMDEHIDRWSRPWGFDNWQNNVGSMRDFARQRPGYARSHLRNYFGIDNEHELTVDVSDAAGGRVHVNTIELAGTTTGIEPEPWPWTGTYFEGVPVTLKAEAWPGYRFSHWEGTESDSATVEITLEQDESIVAVFYRDAESDAFPEPFQLREGPYVFEEWSPDAPQGTYPDNMAFVFMDESEPGLEAGVAGFTDGIYSLGDRTRVNGLGEDGFAFINTGNEEGNPGYPGTRLGGALLALNTRKIEDIQVQWEGQTVLPNSKIYHLRLQYRIGDEGPFKDVPDESGEPVEYRRNETAGHREWVDPVMLPDEINNKAYVQLLWRYYFSGEQQDPDSGQRSQMAVSNITVEALNILNADEQPDLPESYDLQQNYPNPFNPATIIRYDLPDNSNVRLDVFDLLGRRITTLVNERQQAGRHQTVWEAPHRASGIYIYRLQAGDYTETRQMTLIK